MLDNGRRYPPLVVRMAVRSPLDDGISLADYATVALGAFVPDAQPVRAGLPDAFAPVDKVLQRQQGCSPLTPYKLPVILKG